MREPTIPCPSCGASIELEFCPACGERRARADDLSFKKLAEQAVEGVTHLEGKMPRSLLLLLRPGFLAAEFARGARKRFARPMALFLIANAAYYLLQPLTGFNTFRTTLALQKHQMYGGLAQRLIDERLAARAVDRETYAHAFDARSESLSKLLLFAFVPALAALFALLHRGQRRLFGEHLVLALHVKAFVLTYVFLIAVPIWNQVTWRLLPDALQGEGFGSLMTIAIIAAYVTLAFRRLYGDSTTGAIARGVAAAIGYALILLVYRAALFFVAFWTT